LGVLHSQKAFPSSHQMISLSFILNTFSRIHAGSRSHLKFPTG
jgi:hypothetical protein